MYGHAMMTGEHAAILKPAAVGLELPAALAALQRWRGPEGSLVYVDEGLGIEVYAWSEARAHYVKTFAGKRTKSDMYCSYKLSDDGKARRDAFVAQFIQGERERAERKAAEREARKAWQHDCKVGDVFRCSWGYDQTNIDYYEVTRVIGKLVEVRELCSQTDLTGHMSGDCVPMPGNYKTEPDYSQEKVNGTYPRKPKAARRMKPQRCGDGQPYLAVYDFASAYRIEAKEVARGVKVFKPDHWSNYH